MTAVSPGAILWRRLAASPPGSLRSRLGAALLVPALIAATGAGPAEAQLTDPCRVRCGVVLGAASFSFATGVTTVVGRLNGGFSSTTPAITVWSASFAASLGAGVALHADGRRQRRAIYGAGLGAAGGALLGVTVESLFGEGTSARRWTATLVGAALGVAIGGTVGALTHDEGSVPSPVFSVSIPPLSVPLLR